jgi:type II secretory pathway component PulF
MPTDRPYDRSTTEPRERPGGTAAPRGRLRIVARARAGRGAGRPARTQDQRRRDGRRAPRRREGRVLGGAPRQPQVPDIDELGAADTVVGPGVVARPPGRWSPDATELRLLSELVDGGLTLEQALAQLREVGRAGRRGAGLARVHDEVRAGRSLPDALADVAASRHVVALLAGAELSGRMAPGLEAAATLLEGMAELRATVRRALVYPAIVLTVGIGVLLVVSTTVVPRLEVTFADLGGELPTATRMVVAFSELLRSPWSLAACTAFGAALLVRRAVATSGPHVATRVAQWWRPVAAIVAAAGRAVPRTSDAAHGDGLSDEVLARGFRRRLARFAPRVPIIGPLRLAIDVAVSSRVVATLVDQGVAAHVALDLAADGMALTHVRHALRHAARAMRSGEAGTGATELGAVLDPLELRMLDVGAAQGILPPQWARVAARRARQLEGRLSALGATVEPLLVVAVGLLVGGAVLALYLPSFRVLELL